MNNHLIGFVVSALLHVGVVSGAVVLNKSPKKEAPQDKKVVLMVSMFQTKVAPLPPKVIKNTVEKIVEKEPKPIAPVKPIEIPIVKKITEPKPQEVIKAKPLIKPIAVATLVTDTISKPKTLEKPAKVTPEPIIKKAEIIPEKKARPKIIKKKKRIVRKKTAKKPIPKPAPKIAKKKRSVVKTVPKVVKKKTLKRTPRKVVIKKPKQPVRKVIKRVVRKAPVKKHLAKRIVRRPPQRPRTVSSQARARVARPAPRKAATIKKRAAIRQYTQRPRQQPKYTPQRHTVAPRPTVAASAKTAQLNKQYKARLQQLIVSNKRYPRRAKRRNQQGKVTLSFIVSHSGTISNIKILKSANIAALDKASLLAIQQSSAKLRFFPAMPKKSMKLSITLSYILR